MNRSFQSVVIAFFASILLISGCSSGSSTGVSFSKQTVTEKQCFAEYVSFYGDVQDALLVEFGLDDWTYDYDHWATPFPGNHMFGDAADFGKGHYHRTGAKEGRQLPYGCERFLRPDPRCFREHFYLTADTSLLFVDGDEIEAIHEMEVIHGVTTAQSTAAMGYNHWIDHGRDEGRAVPTRVQGTSIALNCQGMITHQPVCRPGSRFPNCDASQDLGATGLGAALAAAAAEAQACALRGGALNTDTNQCTIPEEEEGDSCQNRSLGGLCLD